MNPSRCTARGSRNQAFQHRVTAIAICVPSSRPPYLLRRKSFPINGLGVLKNTDVWRFRKTGIASNAKLTEFRLAGATTASFSSQFSIEEPILKPRNTGNARKGRHEEVRLLFHAVCVFGECTQESRTSTGITRGPIFLVIRMGEKPKKGAGLLRRKTSWCLRANDVANA